MNNEHKECNKAHLAMQDTLMVVGGKWKLVLLSILITGGKKRFRELSRESGISPRILSKELQELEMNELVSRTVCNTRPVTVEYNPLQRDAFRGHHRDEQMGQAAPGAYYRQSQG
jgi:DNA-binding HxlR family transcriptional regulator